MVENATLLISEQYTLKVSDLIKICFDSYDRDADVTYYARKDDGVLLTMSEPGSPTHILTLANVYDDGSHLFFTDDPDLDPVINTNDPNAEFEVDVWMKVPK